MLKFFRFIIQSYVFKRIVPVTLIFILLLLSVNKLFDNLWETEATIPLLDLSNVYKPPVQYNNIKKLRVILTEDKKIAIEGNKKFRIEGHLKDFDYYDSTSIILPSEKEDITNTIKLEFADSPVKDSVLLVISKARDNTFYWYQVFLSTVAIEKLNSFSDKPEVFRINENILAEPDILINNDTLVYKVINYFETNKEKLKLADCETNSYTFSDICLKFNLPCRRIGLHGGDAGQMGYMSELGYPQHAICEVYSSKFNKWYVIDPTYGMRFKISGSDDYLNAVEISNMFFFNREKFIEQDSILSTKRTTLGRDYFKYYENVYYEQEYNPARPGRVFLQYFFKKFNYRSFHYTNILVLWNNGLYYIGIKSTLYILLTIIYFNAIILLIARRLFTAKKPKNY